MFSFISGRAPLASRPFVLSGFWGFSKWQSEWFRGYVVIELTEITSIDLFLHLEQAMTHFWYQVLVELEKLGAGFDECHLVHPLPASPPLPLHLHLCPSRHAGNTKVLIFIFAIFSMRVRGLFSLVYNPTSLFAPFHKKIQVMVSLLLLHPLTKIILTSIIILISPPILIIFSSSEATSTSPRADPPPTLTPSPARFSPSFRSPSTSKSSSLALFAFWPISPTSSSSYPPVGIVAWLQFNVFPRGRCIQCIEHHHHHYLSRGHQKPPN